jgi:hypothetical protein
VTVRIDEARQDSPTTQIDDQLAGRWVDVGSSAGEGDPARMDRQRVDDARV